MQQIQERLQANFIQQTHLLDAIDKKGGEVAQSQLLALRQEQQQLMQQWQFTQRKYFLQRGLHPIFKDLFKKKITLVLFNAKSAERSNRT